MKIKSLILYSVLLIGGGLGLQGCIDSEDPNARHNEEVRIIDQYLQANAIQDVIYDHVYGVRFVVQQTGKLPPANATDKIKGTYAASILYDDGTTQAFDFGAIDDKVQDIEPSALPYLAGFLFEGSSGVIYSPSRYAFGESGNASLDVPANAIVIYSLNITEVTRTTQWVDRMEIDTAAIHNYIEDEEIVGAIQHESGFWYKIDKEGTGAYARSFSMVNFDYKLQLLLGSGPGNVIQDQSLSNQSVWNLIDALKLGFPLLQEGTEATFYIPSGLGYGDTETGAIPKNSNLVFKIKLTDIVTQ